MRGHHAVAGGCHRTPAGARIVSTAPHALKKSRATISNGCCRRSDRRFHNASPVSWSAAKPPASACPGKRASSPHPVCRRVVSVRRSAMPHHSPALERVAAIAVRGEFWQKFFSHLSGRSACNGKNGRGWISYGLLCCVRSGFHSIHAEADARIKCDARTACALCETSDSIYRRPCRLTIRRMWIFL